MKRVPGREKPGPLWIPQGVEVREAPAGSLLRGWGEPAEIIMEDRNEIGGPLPKSRPRVATGDPR